MRLENDRKRKQRGLKEKGLDGLSSKSFKTDTNYNEDLSEYEEDLSALDENIARLRLRYEAQYAAMNAAVASLKETEKALDNMMEAWKAGLMAG